MRVREQQSGKSQKLNQPSKENAVADSNISNSNISNNCSISSSSNTVQASNPCAVNCDVATMIELETRELTVSPVRNDTRQQARDDKSVWGPLFKSRQDFLDMHLC